MSKLANALAAALLLSSVASAQTKLTVAIYSPNAPFESGQARYSFIQRLADQIKSVTGTQADPKAFARAADFEAAVKNKAVDFAVVDGVYMAERGGTTYKVLAVATAKGDTTVPWGLFAKDSSIGSVMDCQGKKLAFASTGPKDQQLVDNAFLDGELPKHFSARQNTPDVASAVTAVSVKSADCVFAPDSLGKVLHKVLSVGSVPNPAFVQINTALPEATVKKVKDAVVGHTAAGGAYDGWKNGSADNFRSLGNKLGGKTRKPIMTEPEVVKLDDTDVVVPPALEASSPNIKDQFWNPSGLP
jgi:hypothetical protein